MSKSAAAPKRGSRRTWISGALMLCALVAIVIYFVQQRQFAEMVRQTRPEWLIVALLLQVGTYVCAGAVWHRALVRLGTPPPLLTLASLGLVKHFMDQMVPTAGVSGTILVAQSLRHRGVPNRNAFATVLASLVTFYLATALAVGIALFILWRAGQVSRLVTTVATVLAVVVAVVPVGILRMTRRQRTRFPAWMRRIGPLKHLIAALGEPPTPGLRNVPFVAETTALQLAIIVLDAATLWALLYAAGATAPADAVFAAFAIASMAGNLSILPGGLGTFDGALIGLLRAYDVPLQSTLAATVLFRGLSLVLPLLPGFFLTRPEVGRRGVIEQGGTS